MTQAKYRPDIDGLRSIAVLPVVLFHAGVAGVGGGYVGVDVFFVISGYLIAGILLSDLERGRYSIGRFYQRRVRRIFPALAVVVAATLLAGAALLMPDALTEVARSALAVGAFCSNFFFWKSVDYFADSQAVQPLLHTWSLAVEEQFYIVFPPFLAFLYRRRWPLAPILGGLALISFGGAAALVFIKPSGTFYLPFTRAWELLAGVLIAVGAAPAGGSAAWRGRAGALGLALILLPVVLYTSRTVFPGLAALPPVLGAALVIWSGERGPTPVGRLLAMRPFVWVGLISYSLYLWHVPIFAYGGYLAGGKLPALGKVGAIALTFLLAWASYRFIETPFRVTTGWRVRWPVTVGAGAMIAAAAGAGALVLTAGWPGRLDARGQELVEAASTKPYHNECLSVGEIIVPPARACRLGAPGVAPTVLLWGDSHTMAPALAMEREARARGRAFLFAATADCPPGLGFAIDGGTEPALTHQGAYRYCEEYNRAMLDRALADPAIRTVVIAARWTNWRIGEPPNPVEDFVDVRLRDANGVSPSVAANAGMWARGFVRLLRELKAGGKQVVIVGPLPEPPFNVPKRLFVERFGMVAPAGPIPIARYQERHRRILAFFGQVERSGLARFIWLAPALCRQERCPIEGAYGPVFFDQDHLSARAALRTAPLYAPVFR